MEINSRAIVLLRHVLTVNGEKEVNKDGEEVASLRRLNGEESSQRRHFFNLTNDIVTKNQEEFKVLIDDYNLNFKEERELLKKKNPQKKTEKDEEYNLKIDNLVKECEPLKEKLKNINAVSKEIEEKKHLIEITDKTLAVVKKYYKEFGDLVGYALGDDQIIEELEEILK